MQREIKFRGLTLENKWVYGSFTNQRLRGLWIEHKEEGRHYLTHVKDETVGQFTGLFDRVNKKEIYEGDVVKALNRAYDNDDSYKEYFETFKVYYVNGCFMFGNWGAHEFLNRFIYTEVIGDKWITPELWEVAH